MTRRLYYTLALAFCAGMSGWMGGAWDGARRERARILDVMPEPFVFEAVGYHQDDTRAEDLESLYGYLQDSAPALYPVSLHAREMDYALGETEWDEDAGHFRIYLDPRMGRDLTLEVRLHEWAHCLAWDTPRKYGGPHGSYWGVAYAEAYRTFLLWNIIKDLDK